MQRGASSVAASQVRSELRKRSLNTRTLESLERFWNAFFELTACCLPAGLLQGCSGCRLYRIQSGPVQEFHENETPLLAILHACKHAVTAVSLTDFRQLDGPNKSVSHKGASHQTIPELNGLHCLTAAVDGLILKCPLAKHCRRKLGSPALLTDTARARL